MTNIYTTYHLILKLLRAASVGNRARLEQKHIHVTKCTCNVLSFHGYTETGLPHTAGSSRQEAWLETVTSGVPFGRPRVAWRRRSRFFTWTFCPPPAYITYICEHNIYELFPQVLHQSTSIPAALADLLVGTKPDWMSPLWSFKQPLPKAHTIHVHAPNLELIILYVLRRFSFW